jgi:predicted RNase H-like HicB family nuclease
VIPVDDHGTEFMEYIAYLHKDRKSDFGVSFPDFPGCVTAGKTLDEARRMAAEALSLHIEGMVEDGEPIPEPSTIDDIADDPAMMGAVAFLVSVGLDITVRVNITARESQVAAIDQKAEEAGMTRSAYMVRAALGPGTAEARPKPTGAQKQRGRSTQIGGSKRKNGAGISVTRQVKRTV